MTRDPNSRARPASCAPRSFEHPTWKAEDCARKLAAWGVLLAHATPGSAYGRRYVEALNAWCRGTGRGAAVTARLNAWWRARRHVGRSGYDATDRVLLEFYEAPRRLRAHPADAPDVWRRMLAAFVELAAERGHERQGARVFFLAAHAQHLGALAPDVDGRPAEDLDGLQLARVDGQPGLEVSPNVRVEVSPNVRVAEDLDGRELHQGGRRRACG